MSTASLLRIPTTDLRRRLGTRREVQRTVPASAIPDLVGVAGTVVPPDGEIALDLVLESVPEGVMAIGSLLAPWVAECRRCLEPVSGEIEVEVHELFEPDPTPDDTYPLDDEAVDLEPMVRDSVLLALPLSVLCAEDCAGPDPERFPAEIEADPETGSSVAETAAEDDGGPSGDPRWAALREIRFENED